MRIFLTLSLICSALLLGMYLNANGHATATVEKTIFAAVMVTVNAIVINMRLK